MEFNATFSYIMVLSFICCRPTCENLPSVATGVGRGRIPVSTPLFGPYFIYAGGLLDSALSIDWSSQPPPFTYHRDVLFYLFFSMNTSFFNSLMVGSSKMLCLMGQSVKWYFERLFTP